MSSKSTGTIGMCFALIISMMFENGLAIGLSVGMAIGLIVGTYIDNKKISEL